MKDEVSNVANQKSDTVIVGGSFDDSIVNYYDDTNVTIFGQGGNDTIYNNYGYRSTLFGGAGNDSFLNISNEVMVLGGDGTDTIENRAQTET